MTLLSYTFVILMATNAIASKTDMMLYIVLGIHRCLQTRQEVLVGENSRTLMIHLICGIDH